MACGSSASSAPVKQEVLFTRVFDAPRELVFEAWTDPKHVAAWWGPNRFTNPRCDWDARSGGDIYVDMRGPDGTIYPMTGKFREVVAPERLVFISAVPDGKGGSLFEVLNTVTFTEQDGKTTLTLHARVISKADGADAYLSGMEMGWAQTLDRLAAHVARAASDTSDREMVFMRVFDAPREMVFKLWTEREHVEQWWGPNGFSVTTSSMDVRPGGVWRFVMHGPDGRDYQNVITFLEINPPARLVYKHGGDKDAEPVNFTITVTFEDQNGKTKLTMRGVFPSAAARDYCIKTYHADEGGKQTLARLAEYVAKV